MAGSAEEWDKIASARAAQIISGADLTYQYVLSPAVLSLATREEAELLGRVLDVGCGVGELTRVLAARSGQVVGIDPSRESVRLARERTRQFRNVAIIQSTVEDFSDRRPSDQWDRFSVVIANMVLSTVIDLDAVLGAIHRLMLADGDFIMTVPHPWFWPQHRGFGSEPWFDYSAKHVLKLPFRIAQDDTLAEHETTFVHRPLEAYFRALSRAGFVVDAVEELRPSPGAQETHEYFRSWRYPRFLALVASTKRPDERSSA